ncbi:hypothetical protein ACI78Q_02055 [Geodermatophilus sp. SYSU D00705]
MARNGIGVLAVLAVAVVGCGQTDYSGGLEQPPTEGVPTAGPGSGESIAAHLHYTMQRNNPETLFEDPDCPDVPEAVPGAEVTCQMTVGADEQERRDFLLRMDAAGLWQVVEG